MRHAETLRANGGGLALARPSSNIQMVLDILDLGDRLRAYASVDAAFEALGP